MGRETFQARLRALASDPDRHARAAALERLRAEVTLADVHTAAGLLVRDADERVRCTAAEVLGADIGDGLAARRLEEVAALYDDGGPRLEAIAIELGRTRSVGAVRVLGLLAGHADVVTRHGAVLGLAELLPLEGTAAGPLRYLAGDDDALVSSVARLALDDAQVD